MTNDPFGFADMMKMFDPKNFADAFDPAKLQATFSQAQMPGFDMNALAAGNQKYFEAIQEANRQTAEAYSELYKKQMSILKSLMDAAQARATQPGLMNAADGPAKQAEIYRMAMEKAVANMTELANATKSANEQAFSDVQKRVQDAIGEINKL